MASLIESVRKLHGPHVVAHDNGYDVDVICSECTRLRLEALDQAAGGGEDLSYSAESARVSYPCTTRVVAGTTAVEGKEEAARMRLDRLVIQREEIEEQMERIDAVITLIHRDFGEGTDATPGVDDPEDEESSKLSSAGSKHSGAGGVSDEEPSEEGSSDTTGSDSEAAADYDF